MCINTIEGRFGEDSQTASPAHEVTAVAPLRIRFTLPERFAGHLQMGDSLAITSADVPSELHDAKIISVSPVVDPASGTIEAVAEVVGSSGALRPGMTATVRFKNLQ